MCIYIYIYREREMYYNVESYHYGKFVFKTNVVLQFANTFGNVMQSQLAAAMLDNGRLAEYGRKPHRECWAQKSLSRTSTNWHARKAQRGAVSSNSRFQAVLIQRYSANLSDMYIFISLSLYIYIYIYICSLFL